MKLFKLAVLNLFFFLVTQDVYGQEGYFPGHIVTLEGDTLSGQVMDRKSPPFSRIYEKIKFVDARGKRKKYKPTQIAAYRVEDRFFESVWVEQTTRGFSSFYQIRPGVGEKIFLKVVTKGTLTHYQLEFQEQGTEDVDDIDFFKRKDDDYMVRATQGLLGLKRKKLIEYFNDCPSLQSKIQTKAFKYPGPVVDYYNTTCSE
ncbi:hypothetical protein FNH22_00745 [Fulvivirga sp. M361]|uniref:hypothetical protein n=1 Tax=Fulvivirga sp. M361 TaxID=2594266 RepID=UPI00117AF6BC|nr:hypothetical protein [Fulvivirga sp. M361]TRX62655.1 hypothetical protein FNH22_00745 [Fulvivirga sp. M361]